MRELFRMRKTDNFSQIISLTRSRSSFKRELAARYHFGANVSAWKISTTADGMNS